MNAPAGDVDLQALRRRHALVQGIARPCLLPRVHLRTAQEKQCVNHSHFTVSRHLQQNGKPWDYVKLTQTVK